MLPVQLYGLSGQRRGRYICYRGILRLIDQTFGSTVPAKVMDFLSVALAVTAADTFVQRESSEDGWTCQLSLRLSS